tara:strand:+ start:583 stop:1017 length:435 start_codon:yes stop_codon:yes gene_type:complete
MTPTVPEVFAKFEKAKSKRDRISCLKKHDTFALKTVLQGAFHPELKLELPPGAPPYTPDDSPAGHSPSHLEMEARKFGYFVNAGNLIQKKELRESKFIEMLESVHADEAEVVIRMKDKDLQVKGLTYELVREAFPDLNLPEKEE